MILLGGESTRKVTIAAISSVVSLCIMCLYSLNAMQNGIRFDFRPQNLLTAIYSISVFIIFHEVKIEKLPGVLERVAKQSANIYYIHGLVVNMIVIVMNRLQLQYRFPVLFEITAVIFTLILSCVGGVCVNDAMGLLKTVKNNAIKLER